ncbi:ubiquinone biosynthesis hydroxylase [Pseudolabrys taiwanensis]|uniref:Ubiquinone biosynthesis hydroxylase n=1 Tax=Pseudolabrys taiwanensis TaxID=331696 RepID=A0A345ZZW8_9HYPH|nr:ubiquinone biosynthesis hydroxylase [Pseudolabrys taiwanensis]AXK82465.1 ubiquinone biosynthesis hydroxylase [Pseudolabrys taiwanensis]
MAGQRERRDVVIGGAGFAGLALAIALRQGLGDSFTVTVADPALAQEKSKDPRASAIAAAARRLFDAIEVWQAVEEEAQPILDMVVTDSKLDDVVRPTFLTFGGEVEEGEPFAHMIENRLLVDALVAKAKALGIDLRATSVTTFENAGNRVEVSLADGATLSARLLVGADGGRSLIREHAGIATHGWDYDQSAIVTTVAHERPHNGRAEEHFLPSGPFAILPLTGNRASIVWTEKRREAERMVALPDDEFLYELEKRFGLHLGDLQVVGPKRAFPLGLFTARSFIGERLALVGDAAHIIHPIAGQGLNMGLRDVAALAEAVADAARLGLDIGAPDVLARYQRWRRFDTAMMGVATDGLNKLFSNRSDVLRFVRDIGLGVVERLPRLKQAFIREAAGFTGDVPKLLKGEGL